MNEVNRVYSEFRDPSNYARCEIPAKGASRFILVVQFTESGRSWQIAFQESPKPAITCSGDEPTQDEFRRAIPASVASAPAVDALWLAVTLDRVRQQLSQAGIGECPKHSRALLDPFGDALRHLVRLLRWAA